MSDTIIRVNNLSKRYRIGAKEQGYKTFREAIINGISAPVRNLVKLRKLTKFKHEQSQNDEKDVIWALKNVSFEVNEGEVLGIIGRNGAGKTTILKVLSRITEPTGGFVEIHGRLSSLLEVGTGFHPELTGRENIFLNGAILGMRKREIEQKFDEIVSFSGIEKFIDTPVKRYSSGMYVRLAFAVAAHLEPEILLVDEVLAVGDIAFQKKCLGKMGDIAQGGRTVLFVSHNMGAIRSLCQSAIWIDNGQIVKRENANEVVRDYQESQLKRFDESSYVVERNSEDVKNSSFYFSRVEMLNGKGEHTTTFRYGEKLILMVNLAGESKIDGYGVSCHIFNELGQLIAIGSSGAYHGIYFNKDVRRVRIEIGPLILTSGRYTISLLCWYGEGITAVQADDWEHACSFTVSECQPFRPGYDISTAKGGVCILQQSFCAVE
ncbi:ABC transporter ATP-binding protein [candidate division KSB1 bacterium]|nr:ABC transporter ATP-binding protein [candidate division KSB1 bacterium]